MRALTEKWMYAKIDWVNKVNEWISTLWGSKKLNEDKNRAAIKNKVI